MATPALMLQGTGSDVGKSVIVAGLARALGAWQIDPMIAFLSSDQPLASPFARTLRILESAPWHERRFPARPGATGIRAADIPQRGLGGGGPPVRSGAVVGLRGWRVGRVAVGQLQMSSAAAGLKRSGLG